MWYVYMLKCQDGALIQVLPIISRRFIGVFAYFDLDQRFLCDRSIEARRYIGQRMEEFPQGMR